MQQKDIGEIIEEETMRRLGEMATNGYEFPAKAALWNWLVIAIAICSSVVLVGLCMMGVIS